MVPQATKTRDIRIDQASSVPLYQQIAEAIRDQIESGNLAPGDALSPLRDAAEKWGVNLHTVRHAYTALAREGLVLTSRGARGTRIAPSALESTSPKREYESALKNLLTSARAAGVSDAQIIKAIRGLARTIAADRPAVYIVECSRWQCETHSQEIEKIWNVDARPWPLEDGEPPTDGLIIATYFHYNDIRRNWPHRLRDVQFITVSPDPELFTRCQKLTGVQTLLLVEPDEPTAQSVLADVSAIPEASGWDIQCLVSDDITKAVHNIPATAAALLSPRVWASLDAKTRSLRQAIELRYRFDTKELNTLGTTQQWEKKR